MARHVLVGRHVKVTLWDDLADLMPGGSVGLITQAVGDGDDAELTVQLRGFRSTFIFLLGEVALLPSDYTEEALFPATRAAQPQEAVESALPIGSVGRHPDASRRSATRTTQTLSRPPRGSQPILSTELDEFQGTYG